MVSLSSGTVGVGALTATCSGAVNKAGNAGPPTLVTYLVRAALGSFISAQQKSLSIAKQSKVVLSLAFGLARRHQATYRNSVRVTARLHRPPTRANELGREDVQASRRVQSTWPATVAAVRGS